MLQRRALWRISISMIFNVHTTQFHASLDRKFGSNIWTSTERMGKLRLYSTNSAPALTVCDGLESERPMSWNQTNFPLDMALVHPQAGRRCHNCKPCNPCPKWTQISNGPQHVPTNSWKLWGAIPTIDKGCTSKSAHTPPLQRQASLRIINAVLFLTWQMDTNGAAEDGFRKHGFLLGSWILRNHLVPHGSSAGSLGLHGQAHEVNATCSAAGEGHHLFMGVVQSKPTWGEAWKRPRTNGGNMREPMGNFPWDFTNMGHESSWDIILGYKKQYGSVWYTWRTWCPEIPGMTQIWDPDAPGWPRQKLLNSKSNVCIKWLNIGYRMTTRGHLWALDDWMDVLSILLFAHFWSTRIIFHHILKT